MSDNTQQPVSLLDPDTAYATVHQRVYTPVFFEKLAQDFGLRPETEKEAMDMLMMAAQLRESYDNDQQKQASAQSGTLDAAKVHLGMVLTDEHNGQLPAQVVAKVASERASDPEIAHAVLSLQAAANGAGPEQPAQADAA
jgi:hypothetical protein